MGWYGLETYFVSLRMFRDFWLVKMAQLGFRDCNYYEVKLNVKCASFSSDNGRTQYCPFLTLFLTIKTLSQNISITLLQISLTLHEHRGGYWRKKLP